MGDAVKREYDMLSIKKDIAEREKIVQQFRCTGVIDRNDAIDKLVKLQTKNGKLAVATMAKQNANGYVDLYQTDNSTIIMNIQFQIDFLRVELAELVLEEMKDGRYKTF